MTATKKPQPAAVVSFRITSDTLEAIDRIARNSKPKQSRTDVITAALIAYAAKHKAPAKAPAAKKAKAAK